MKIDVKLLPQEDIILGNLSKPKSTKDSAPTASSEVPQVCPRCGESGILNNWVCWECETCGYAWDKVTDMKPSDQEVK